MHLNLQFNHPTANLNMHACKEAEAVEGLQRRLAQLLAFLDNDSENQLNDDDETTKEWKGRLKEVALRIEDDIESEIIYRYGTEQPRSPLIGRLRKYGSLFCFHDDVGHGYRLPATPHFKRLRVLDLCSLHFITGIPSYVADLILLRYLALRPSKSLNSLPVLKDWNLQTLVLLENRGGSTSADDPNPLIPWELPKLRHLQVCTTFVLGTPTAIHHYLQTVQWLRPFQCREQVFLRIPNAKVMGIFMEGSVEFGEANCLDNLRYLDQLEELKIESRHFYPFLLPVVDVFPVQLKKLKLKGTLLPWDAMTVIGMLPNLQVLQLKNGACQGPHWELTQGSFRQLKSLLIYGSDLMHWEATGNNVFPVLERLILKECYELEAIPSSFEDILTLKLIELCHCYSRLVNSAKRIQEEQRDYGNYALVVRAYNIWRIAEEEVE
nr:putative late blight resistance protein homolog R1A-10 isoform X1 [Ipomoea batatas]